MPKFEITRRINQVVDGTEYNGEVVFSGDEDKTLTYEVRFSVPIPKLEEQPPSQGIEGVKRLIAISIKTADDKEIELTDKMYVFFVKLLASFAIDFFNNSQTRSSNEGFLGMAARGEFSDLVKASFGMSDTVVWELSEDFVNYFQEIAGISL